MVSFANPTLFGRRLAQLIATRGQYFGTDTEIDNETTPSLYRQKNGADSATAAQFAGSYGEMDPKPPGFLVHRNRDARATQYDRADAEIDVKTIPSLFGQMRDADPVTAAQYVGSDAEMDVKPSDRRLKNEIRRIGVSPSGLAVYSFRYIWGGPTFVGVMAQDLLATRPDAVIQTESGYLMVDYDKIDVKMTGLDTYDASQIAAETGDEFSAPALFARRRRADSAIGAQYVGSDAEMDVKISDRRFKNEIRLIGVSPSGLAVYSFRYIWGGPTFAGVMAQDLLATRPDAVIQTESGYLMVDYDKIDVKMTSLSTPALFARRRAADRVFGSQHIGVESEADVKPKAPATAAQYVGSNTEIDVKPN